MSHTLRIGTNTDSYDPFWVEANEAIYHGAEQLGIEVTALHANYLHLRRHPDKNAETLIDELLAQNIDAIIGWDLSESLALRVLDAGIPIVCNGEEMPFRHPLLARRTGQGMYDAGQLLGNYIVERLGRRGHVLIAGGLMQHKRSGDGRNRLAGLRDVFELQTQLQWTHVPTYWNPEEAYPLIYATLQARTEPLDAIVGISDSLALAAREAARALGRLSPQTLITGINGDIPILAAIADGSFTATVETSATDLGQQMLDIACQAAQRLPFPEFFNFKRIRLVTVHNVKEVAAQKLLDTANLSNRLIGTQRYLEEANAQLKEEIAERKQSEAALRTSEERYRLLVERMNDGLTVIDQSAKFTYVNKRFCELIEFSADELIGRQVISFLDEPSRAVFQQQIAQRRLGEASVYEQNWLTKYGRRLSTLISATPILRNGSEFDGGFAVVTDITERKQAEEALRESETRYRSIVTAITEGIVLQDSNGVILTWNTAVGPILGLTDDELSGRTSVDLDRLTIYEDGSHFPGELHPAMITLKTGEPQRNVIMGIQKSDGSLTWISVNSEPLIHPNTTQPYAVVTSFADITERKHAEDALRESEKRFSTIFRTSPVSISISHISTRRFVDMNDAHLTMHGYSREELLSGTLTVANMWPYPEQRVAYEQMRDKQGRVGQFEYAFRKKSGEIGFAVLFSERITLDGDAYSVAFSLDITERKRVDEALRESEKQYRVLAENSMDMISRHSPDGVYLYVSPACLPLLGYEPSELIGRSAYEFFHPEDVTAIAHSHHMILEQPIIYTVSYRIRRKDGQYIWFETNSRTLRDSQTGAVIEIQAGSRDITDHKQADKALQESEAKFSTAFQSGPSASSVTSVKDRIYLDVNERFLQLTGYSREEVVGHTSAELMLWAEPEQGQQFWQMLPERATVDNFEYSYRRKNGEVGEGMVSATLITLAGEICILSQSIDITERKRAEQELRNSEMRFRTFVDHATDAFFMHYTQGIVLDVNRQACESLGYTREELIGMSPKMFDPNATPEFMAFLDSRLRNGETVSFDTYHQRKDGTMFPVEVRIRPFTDRGHWASVSLVRDITERKQREATLRRQNEYLTALHETTLALMNRFNATELLNAILSRVVALVGTAYGSVYLFSSDKTQLTAAIHTGYSREMPLRHAEIGKGLSGMVWQTGQTVVVNDYQNWEHRSEGMIPSQIRANIGIPLKTDEELIGILCVDYHEVGRTFSDEDVAILTRFAGLASIALDNARLYNSVQQELEERKQVELTLQRYNKRLSILRDIDHQILFASSPQSIANVVLKYLAELIPCEFLSIILHDPELTEERIFALRYTPDLGGVYTQEIQPVVQNEVLEKLKSGKTAIAPDLLQQAGPHAHLAEELESHGVRSALASPMIVQNRLIGTIALAAREVGFFTSEHQQITEEVSAQIAIALQQAELKDQLAQYNVELEQRVRERTTQLEHANHELELFSYSVSHDLRAPLRAIQGFAEIIVRRHRDSLNDEARRYFDNIVTASEQMNKLIIDLLAYARLGRGRTPQMQVIPLSLLMSEVIASLTPQLEEAGAQLHVAEALPAVWGDKTLLKQILINLLENALIYHQLHIPPMIDVSFVIDADNIIIHITDNGIGIPPEFHEKIFHIFQRLHNQDQYPGTGIGLAIVKKSVEMLNGSVWVESVPTSGSMFCVKLKHGV